jgi:hypothetical protein
LILSIILPQQMDDAMKRRLCTLMILAGFACSASAQVGFVNDTIVTGNNLIANDLSASPDNTLNNVLTFGVLTGSTFTEWDPVVQQFMPLSTFNGSTWSINYTFAPDQTGGELNSPGSTTVTFFGSVVTGFVPPTRFQGVYLLGFPDAVNATTFQEIVGRGPANGEFVKTLDPATQTFIITTFNNGTWNNGVPSVPVGGSAFIGLVVPEPSVTTLAGCGALIFLIGRRLTQRSSGQA